MFGDSKIVVLEDHKVFLKKNLPELKEPPKLLYRGSVNGWKMKDFHKLCDNKGPTLTLFLLPTNRICAGFTSESWETGFGKYKSDSKSLLFSFDAAVTATATITSTPTPTSYKVFPVKNPEKAIFCRNDYGPCFGDNELSASYEPMNG